MAATSAPGWYGLLPPASEAPARLMVTFRFGAVAHRSASLRTPRTALSCACPGFYPLVGRSSARCLAEGSGYCSLGAMPATRSGLYFIARPSPGPTEGSPFRLGMKAKSLLARHMGRLAYRCLPRPPLLHIVGIAALPSVLQARQRACRIGHRLEAGKVEHPSIPARRPTTCRGFHRRPGSAPSIGGRRLNSASTGCLGLLGPTRTPRSSSHFSSYWWHFRQWCWGSSLHGRRLRCRTRTQRPAPPRPAPNAPTPRVRHSRPTLRTQCPRPAPGQPAPVSGIRHPAIQHPRTWTRHCSLAVGS